jgi:dienelactone hydrolase
MMSRMIGAYASAFFVCLVGCGGADEPPHVEGACIPDAAGQRLSEEEVDTRGAFAVGQLVTTIVDDSRTTPAHGGAAELSSRTLPLRVWYPATEAGMGMAVASGGPFPLVLYSHGFSSYLTEGSNLAAHLASRGYIVMAPEFPLTHLTTPGGPTIIDLVNQPGDISFVLDTALAWNVLDGNLFEGAIDETRVAAAGLSLGGLTTLLVAFHPTLHDPRVRIAAAMAPPADILGEAFYDTRTVPLLILSGDIDAIVAHEPNAVAALMRANSPVALLTLAAGTHTGFTAIANSLDGLNNADETGCAGLSGGGAGGPVYDLVAALGGEAAGIVPQVESEACPDVLPRGMRPTRQLQVERVAVLSFFDAYFHADAVERGRSCDFNERVLRRAPDLEYERK